MIRKDSEGATRRPMLMYDDNRVMVQNICDNLAHTRRDRAPSSSIGIYRQLDTAGSDAGSGSGVSGLQLRNDLSLSTPNLLGGGGGGALGMAISTERDNQAYNALALASIRQELSGKEVPGYHSTTTPAPGRLKEDEVAMVAGKLKAMNIEDQQRMYGHPSKRNNVVQPKATMHNAYRETGLAAAMQADGRQIYMELAQYSSPSENSSIRSESPAAGPPPPAYRPLVQPPSVAAADRSSSPPPPLPPPRKKTHSALRNVLSPAQPKPAPPLVNGNVPDQATINHIFQQQQRSIAMNSAANGPSYKAPPPYNAHVLPNRLSRTDATLPQYQQVAAAQQLYQYAHSDSSHSPSPAPSLQNHSYNTDSSPVAQPMYLAATVGNSVQPQPVAMNKWNVGQSVINVANSTEVKRPVMQMATPVAAPISRPVQQRQVAYAVNHDVEQSTQHAQLYKQAVSQQTANAQQIVSVDGNAYTAIQHSALGRYHPPVAHPSSALPGSLPQDDMVLGSGQAPPVYHPSLQQPVVTSQATVHHPHFYNHQHIAVPQQTTYSHQPQVAVGPNRGINTTGSLGSMGGYNHAVVTSGLGSGNGLGPAAVSAMVANDVSGNGNVGIYPGAQQHPGISPMAATHVVVTNTDEAALAYARLVGQQRHIANQSPQSVISTNSTRSANSDQVIHDRPPPPYPGTVKLSNVPNRQPPSYVPLQLEDTGQYQVDEPELIGAATAGAPALDIADKTVVIYDDFGARASPRPDVDPDTTTRDTRLKSFSSQAFKFYMEQHIENVFKTYEERRRRLQQLHREMANAELEEATQMNVLKLLYQKESNYLRLKRANMNISMFTPLKKLGVGAFGSVSLVQKKDNKQLYAMKTLKKQEVLKRNQVAHVKAERDILAEADNEWVVKLYYSFQDEENLYFVMDYIPGGDMMGLLQKKGIFTEDLSRVFIAELVLAVESVHLMGFIHRDIKPDNILIDKDGHIKLTDFGLCTGFRWTHMSKYYQKGSHKRVNSMEHEWNDSSSVRKTKPLERRYHDKRTVAHSLVGTPNYIAPEVLEQSGYTACCDWWSVGVILYEMLAGIAPFHDDDPRKTQEKVINFKTTLKIPTDVVSPKATDLIRKLCTDAKERLGRGGANEIKAHPFFQSIKFDTLRQKTALHIPDIKHSMDTSNFDPVDFPLRPSGDGTTKENGKHLEKSEFEFLEFTFRRFFDHHGNPYPIQTAAAIEELESEEELNEESQHDPNSAIYV